MAKKTLAICQRCGEKISSFSAMRKWCIECRNIIRLEQARVRKQKKKILKTN